MIENTIKKSLAESAEIAHAVANDNAVINQIEKSATLIAACFKNKGKVLICGNGGSMCDAMHFAEEFTGRFRKDRPALPAIAISDPSHITCTANDYGFEHIFSRGVEAFGQPKDVFIGISTSGNSSNIIKAFQTAKEHHLSTISFLGKDGGKLAGCADIEFICPGKTTDRIQEVHMIILHILIEHVERLLFPKHY